MVPFMHVSAPIKRIFLHLLTLSSVYARQYRMLRRLFFTHNFLIRVLWFSKFILFESLIYISSFVQFSAVLLALLWVFFIAWLDLWCSLTLVWWRIFRRCFRNTLLALFYLYSSNTSQKIVFYVLSKSSHCLAAFTRLYQLFCKFISLLVIFTSNQHKKLSSFNVYPFFLLEAKSPLLRPGVILSHLIFFNHLLFDVHGAGVDFLMKFYVIEYGERMGNEE